MLSVKQSGIKYHFFYSLVWLDLGLNPGLPDHWRTLYSLGQWPKTVLFQTIPFSTHTQFSSIWPMDRTLLGATTTSQSGPGSDGNEGVLHISQSFSITGASPSDCLVSYPRHLLGELFSSAEMQSVYSAAPADCANGMLANMMNYDVIVSKFKLQSCYYVHFQTNFFGKGMSTLIHLNYGLNSTTTVLQRWLWY